MQWIELELKSQNFTVAQDLFTRSLPNLPHLDLWKLYLTFVQRVNTPENAATGGMSNEQRLTITQAFEYTLLNIGLDPQSTSIWKDYLKFIQSWQVGA